jgi:hypothetical protein
VTYGLDHYADGGTSAVKGKYIDRANLGNIVNPLQIEGAMKWFMGGIFVTRGGVASIGTKKEAKSHEDGSSVQR